MKPARFRNLFLMSAPFAALLVFGTGCGNRGTSGSRDVSPPVYPFNNPENEIFDTLRGEFIPDPYHWLENIEDQKVLNWAKKQNQTTFDYISQLDDRIKIYNRLEELILPREYKKASREGNYYFYTANEEFPENEVVYFSRLDNPAENIFINLKTFTGNPNARFSSLAVSPDNQLAAFSIQDAVTGNEKIFIKNMETNSFLNEVIPCSFNTSIAWDNQGGFFYNKPVKSEFSKDKIQYAVFYHVPGTPYTQDVPVFVNSDFPGQFHQVQVTSDFRYVIITSQNKDSNTQIRYADLTAPPPTPFKTLAAELGPKAIVVDNWNESFLVQTTFKAPGGRLVRIELKDPDPKNWKTIIPETQDIMKRVYSANGLFYVRSSLHMTGKITAYDSSGNRIRTLEMPGLGIVEGFSCKPGYSDALYTFQSFNRPLTIYRYQFSQNRSEVFKSPVIKISPDNYIIKKEFGLTAEGVGIPMLIFQKKTTTNNGKNPLIFSFSGGMDDSFAPTYSAGRIPFVDNGGIFVLAAVRGARELDDAWYKKGTGMNRVQSEKDVRTCLDFLIQEKYTSPGKIAILTKHAGAFAAIENSVKSPGRIKLLAIFQGIIDFTEYPKFGGCTKCIQNEVGSPYESREMFDWLKQNSPLLRAYQKQDWPAVYLEHKIIDRVISPVHSFKFIAALQDNSNDETRPKLIRIDNECCAQNRRQELFSLSEKWALAMYMLEMSVR